MNDTNEKMARIYDGMIAGLSSEKRALMGCSMHDFAKEIALSQISSLEKSQSEIMGALFKRFYRGDFEERFFENALNAIREHHANK